MARHHVKTRAVLDGRALMAEMERVRRADDTHALRLEGVGRSFGALVALEAISLRVAAGERHAILGANGAGKTTLFNVITGDLPPDQGRVVFFGEDITALPVYHRIRRGLRRTYQNSLLLSSLSVLDNLFLAACGVTRGRFSFRRPAAADANMNRARDLASLAGLADVAEVPVASLSHGQQRQLEVGLALAGAPRLILFDEPAAGLSPAERRHLIDLLRDLPQYVGFIIIEHDLDVALRVAEQVTVMNKGRIFKQGTPQQIEADADVQAIYLRGKHD
jgi:branched-chain amino acid transport system ATP-binding protein